MKILIIPSKMLSWYGGIEFFCKLANSMILNDEHQYVILCTEEEKKIIQVLININDFQLEIVKDVNYTKIEHVIQQQQIDLVFSFQLNLGELLDIPWIGYIPDFQHKHLPDLFSDSEIKNRNQSFEKLYKKANKVLLTSQDALNNAALYYPKMVEKNYVLDLKPISVQRLMKDESVFERFNVEKYKYFIICNQFWAHKNYETALAAIDIMVNEEKQNDIKLICTGNLSDYRNLDYINGLNQFLKDHKLEQYVHFLGHVEKVEQLTLVKYAIAVIQPTLYEGVPGGGIASDALVLGKRLILSDITINNEISNENTIYFQKKSAKSLANVMQHVIKVGVYDFSQEDIEKNQIILANSINRLIYLVTQENKTRDLKCILNYSVYDKCIQKDRMGNLLHFIDKPSTQVYKSSIRLVNSNGGNFFKNLSTANVNDIVLKKLGLAEEDNSKIIEEDIFSISIHHYITQYLLKDLPNNHKLYIYGDGGHTKTLLEEVDFSQYNLKGILSKNVKNPSINGIEVSNILDIIIDLHTYILISSSSYEDEIFEELTCTIPTHQIIKIYG
ncbi:hypothetical protein MTP04_09490 [Lysinibacillus sp. PLM2]|nr:hypothetical protein MTP04_09490 [Lysinibacillus sp. PLM2]